MKRKLHRIISKKYALLAMAILFFMTAPGLAANTLASRVMQEDPAILSARKINEHSIELLLAGKKRMLIDFYGDNIFRLFQDNAGGTFRDPEAKPEAKILVDNPRRRLSAISLSDASNQIVIKNQRITILSNPLTSRLSW